jgi:3-oxoadipate enol-lactonase
MQFAQLNGVALHFQIIGAPEGRPVIVFANSLGTDFRIWRDVIVELAGDFALVTYDKRGHGLSDTGKTPYTMDDHVDDLAALLDFLAVRRVIVCGLSVGGLIAQGLQARRPDLVKALILCDTAHKIGTQDSWNARIEAVRTGGIGRIADSVMKLWFTPDFHARFGSELAGYRNMLVRSDVQGYVATCAAIRDCDYTEAARRISVPTLCVVGDQDGSTPPALVSELASLIPGARYELIAGAGHIPCVEQPAALAALIRDFTASLEDRRPRR